MAINLKHSQSGLIKNAPTGFSFTTLLFGVLVHAVRGHWGPAFVTWFTMGLANFYYCFFGNKGYVQHLLEKGYKPATETDYKILTSMGIVVDYDKSEAVKAA